jgi:hypothetical protein
MTNPSFFKQDLYKLTIVNSASAIIPGRFVDSIGNYSSPLITMTVTGNAEVSLLELYTTAVGSSTAKFPEGVFECQPYFTNITVDWRAYPHGAVNTSVVSQATVLKRGVFYVFGVGPYTPERFMGPQTLALCSLNTNSSATACFVTVEFYDLNGRVVPISTGSVSGPQFSHATIVVSGNAKSLSHLLAAHGGFETNSDIPGIPNEAVKGVIRVETTSACGLAYNRGGSPSGLGNEGFYSTLTAPSSASPNRIPIGGVFFF